MTDNKQPFPIEQLTAQAQAEKNKVQTAAPAATPPAADNQIEELIQRVEAAGIDIAPTYAQWRDLGFALVDALGEEGRQPYHRLSGFYPNYNAQETDRQYTACLKGNGQGVTVKTLFHLAKQAGISVSFPQAPDRAASAERSEIANGETSQTRKAVSIATGSENEDEPLPTFPQAVKSNLPQLLQKILARAQSEQDADLLLLGSLTVFSACLPNIEGLYMGLTYNPNLFFFATAKASAGKGRLNLCRLLVDPIHQHLLRRTKAEREAFQQELEQLENANNKAANRLQEPPQRLLFIPADVSSTRFYQHLCENEGVGLMFETEGDTLTRSFNSEHGNYSDGFRKAFQHEKIAYSRRQNKEYVELPRPKFSVLLSGTPQQVLSLIPDAENGLFSRFIFYSLKMQLEWLNPFADRDDTPLERYFTDLGNEFFGLYQTLKELKDPIRFYLTDSQIDSFNAYFSKYQDTFNTLFGEDIIASVRRLALITYRIAMILSALRIPEHGDISAKMTCSDTDYQTAMQMVEVLLHHTMHVYKTLPEVPALIKKTPRNQIWEHFFEDLPPTFNRQVYLTLAKSMSLSPRTADKHIEAYCNIGRLNHLAYDTYAKPTPE